MTSEVVGSGSGAATWPSDPEIVTAGSESSSEAGHRSSAPPAVNARQNATSATASRLPVIGRRIANRPDQPRSDHRDDEE